ncbi:MAG: hypothetical protein ABW140_14075, partial [Candidatus Sedimenticola sp. 6PFRAG1]
YPKSESLTMAPERRRKAILFSQRNKQLIVIPNVAKRRSGIQKRLQLKQLANRTWIPASAGMTHIYPRPW